VIVPPPVAPVLADRYRLDHELCSSPAVQVWRGTDLLLGRTVTISVLKEATGNGPGSLLAKARLTGTVSHPGIIRIYAFEDSCPGFPPFLVSEYVDGTTLAHLMAGGQMPLVNVLDMVAQAAGALHAAHRAGLRHGAIKPPNILVNRDGTVKLTDFGGTPASPYCAPELSCGSPATVPGDIYSVGVIALECLGSTGSELSAADAFLASLTGADPSRRPADAESMAAQASQILTRLRQPAPPAPSYSPRPHIPVYRAA
jgi:serine/threonine protein kinase